MLPSLLERRSLSKNRRGVQPTVEAKVTRIFDFIPIVCDKSGTIFPGFYKYLSFVWSKIEPMVRSDAAGINHSPVPRRNTGESRSCDLSWEAANLRRNDHGSPVIYQLQCALTIYKGARPGTRIVKDDNR